MVKEDYLIFTTEEVQNKPRAEEQESKLIKVWKDMRKRMEDNVKGKNELGL